MNAVSATLVMVLAISFGVRRHDAVAAVLFAAVALLWGSSAVRRFRALAARIEQAEPRP